MKKTLRITAKVILHIFLFVSLLAVLLANWYTGRYGDTGFMSIISTFLTPWTGCSNNLTVSWILNALVPAVLIYLVLALALFTAFKKFTLAIQLKNEKKLQLYPVKPTVARWISIVLSLVLLLSAMFMVRLPAFVYDYYFDETKLYDEQYVDPSEVNITFPETKRNLIYIYLESMETTFMSEEQGGAEQVDLIPELSKLAEENINFSHNDGIGGWPKTTHTTWTSAALVAQTSGLPLTMDLFKIEIGKFLGYLPGAVTLQDILQDEGYAQSVMFGSDGTFGARKEYFELHSEDLEVYDLYSARNDGSIPKDYMVWWGFEDQKLFAFAKEEITALSKGDQPFAFTMLTADTHHIDGYYGCDFCQNQHGEQYENVISCSSRQVAAFVEWIQQQDFYENTTIIICGDHQSMDNQYFVENIDENYDRHVYNCIINAPISTENTTNRQFTPMDMFPTTLAALGCHIEGDRLGLGTNLFSAEKTLAEKLGIKYLNQEIAKRSEFYIKNFIKGD